MRTNKIVLWLLGILSAIYFSSAFAQVKFIESTLEPRFLEPVGTAAKFNPRWAQIFEPDAKNPPILIYAHGGRGLVSSDLRSLEIFKRMGFVTIAFDAFELNRLSKDWVDYNLGGIGRQFFIVETLKGAVEYAYGVQRWNKDRIFLYGSSNGARSAVLVAEAIFEKFPVRAVIASSMAARGYDLPEKLRVPTIFFYGLQDNYGSQTGFSLTYERKLRSGKTVKEWIESVKANSKDVRLVFYDQAGHCFLCGPLTTVQKRTNRRGGVVTDTLGMDDVGRYQTDLSNFVNEMM